MKNRLLLSNFRKIISNKKRFISLMCMALLGVGFFAGIKATSPDMEHTLEKYLKKSNFYDLEIVSNVGLTEDDIRAIDELDIANEINGSKNIYYTFSYKKTDKIFNIISLTDINNVILKSGNLPSKDDEVVLEEKLLDDLNYKIGDTIKIDSESLKNQEYKIVGIVESPLYFTGFKNSNTGRWDYYLYVLEDSFKSDYYTSIYINLKNSNDLETNSEKYLNNINLAVDKIKDIEDKRNEIRYDQLYSDTINQMKKYNLEINYDDFVNPKWFIYDRLDNNAYKTFIDSKESIKQIGSVFPLIFYLVAIFISLISMSRMVEEDRLEIGTLKGLGFSNIHIYSRYLIYSFSATLFGGIIGSIIGINIIPRIIWSIYQTLFIMDGFVAEFNVLYSLIGLLIAIILICGASLLTAYIVLKEKPSELLRPKSPKIGKKIFIEKFKIWKKLRFSTKISIRNIFRYKKRIIVTIIGIAGSTALLLVGFGLKDSIQDIVKFNNNVFVYNKMISLKGTDDDELENKLEENKNITNIVKTYYNTINIYNNDLESYSVNLIVPDNLNNLSKVIKLNDINDDYKQIKLKDNYVVLSQKLAKRMNVSEGDSIQVLINDKYMKIKISNIAENYINDYIYMTKDTYKSLFEEYNYNVYFLTVNDKYDKEYDDEIMNLDIVSNVIDKSTTTNIVDDLMSSLNSVVLVLIVSSAMLAFVILYNLSSINISERKREISTLKVLGFYDEEVDHYITNENYFITVIGILIGLYCGLYLCHYVISTCEVDSVMFIRKINLFSYIISSIISIIFTIIVSKITHYNLKKINMVESLKSNE